LNRIIIKFGLIKPMITPRLRRLSTPSAVDLKGLVEALQWRDKIDQVVHAIEDILLSEEFSPRAMDMHMERASIYSTIGDCFEYSRAKVCAVMKGHREYDDLRQKYDFVM
jgi:hypothetical protein